MKEITVTFYNGRLEAVENLPRGLTLITRDIDEDSGEDGPLIIRRWFPGDISEVLFEGEINDEPADLIHTTKDPVKP